jgi:hypothetical protein
MKSVWTTLLGGMLLLAPVAAQSQTIRGVVLEDGTREPIEGALVELLAADGVAVQQVQTDSIGGFVLVLRRSGEFGMRLRHFAYIPVDAVTLEVRPAERLEIELRMDHRAIPLEPVTVTARRRNVRLEDFYERMQGPGFGRFVTREQIERYPGARTSELLRMMPGVQLVPVSNGRNMILMRGGGTGRCAPTIYLDGMEVKQYPESGVDDFLTASMLEGVEVYTSFASAPSPLHSRDGCGVVAFWTRGGEGGRPWSWKRFAAALGGFALIVTLSR